MSYEPDDGQPVYLLTRGRRTVQKDLLAYRVLAGEVLFRERFINYANMLSVLVILCGKEAAFRKPDSHRGHGIRGDPRNVSRGIATRHGKRPSTDCVRGLPSSEKGILDTGKFHAGDCLKSCSELIYKCSPFRIVVVL